MVPLKRRKTLTCPAVDSGDTGALFPGVVLFLLERRMGASRREFLSQLGRKKGFKVEETLSQSVTHVIAENNSSAEVQTWLQSQGHTPAHLLDISWFTESMRAGRPVEILQRHKLQEQESSGSELAVVSVPSYACQRRTTLENHNTIFTEALSLLAEKAELSEEEGRGVAFRRAAAVLKFLPERVTDRRQLRGLPCLGEHSLRVITDILENGASSEVESTKTSERFKAMKVLTGIFGVGSRTADRWIRDGIMSLKQLQESGQSLNRAQQAGLDHYDDLNQPVTRTEADVIARVVEEAVASVSPRATTTLIGGFRRGKLSGHDVDFLITHPEEGQEVGLMPKVVTWLEKQGFLLYQKTTRNSYLEAKDGPGRPSSNMDRFERCFSIFRLRGDSVEEDEDRGGVRALTTKTETGDKPGADVLEEEPQTKGWRAVRVDLVVSPVSQFAFALLGWTGSKLFERELRRWASHEKKMSLSSHALFDTTQSKYLRATSEEEIFAHLCLEFIPPSGRNA